MFTCMIDPTVDPPNITHWFVKYHFESWVWLYDLLQLSSLESVVTIWWWSWWGYSLLHLYLTSLLSDWEPKKVVQTCQSQRSHTQKHAILYCLSTKTLLLISSMSFQRIFSCSHSRASFIIHIYYHIQISLLENMDPLKKTKEIARDMTALPSPLM